MSNVSLRNQLFFAMPIGMRYMILSAMGFALMAACVKKVSVLGIPVLEIVAARALVSLFLSYIDVKRKRISLMGNNRPLLLIRGVVGALALVCVYYSVTHMPLAEATVLQYLHPMFTAMLAIFFLKERMHWSLFVCICFSFIGLLLVAQPQWLFGGVSDIPDLALLAAVFGAFGSGVAYVIVRKLSQSEDPSVIVFYFPMVALPFSLFLLGGDFVMPNMEACFLLLLVGIFTQVGQVGLTKSMQTEPAGRATAFSYLQVIFSAGLGWAFFSEVPDMLVWLGALSILVGALVNMVFHR
jgi:drug/metabolite transporter (DMT)-like permease